jgi:hypothetical protein
MFPLGHAVIFRYMVPVIVCPGEIFCGIVTLQIISLPGSTRVLVGRHAADRLPYEFVATFINGLKIG